MSGVVPAVGAPGADAGARRPLPHGAPRRVGDDRVDADERGTAEDAGHDRAPLETVGVLHRVAARQAALHRDATE